MDSPAARIRAQPRAVSELGSSGGDDWDERTRVDRIHEPHTHRSPRPGRGDARDADARPVDADARSGPPGPAVPRPGATGADAARRAASGRRTGTPANLIRPRDSVGAAAPGHAHLARLDERRPGTR